MTAMTTRTDVYLRRGWYLSSVDDMARSAARSYNSFKLLAPEDIYDAARGGIIEAIYDQDTDEDLAPVDAWRAALRAATNFDRQTRRVHGFNHDNWTRHSHNAVIFWDEFQVSPSPENRIIDETALHQVWAALSDVDRSTLTAWAVAPDRHVAAAMEGLPRGTFNARLTKAKRAAAALWFDHETAPPAYGHDRKGALDSQRHKEWRKRRGQPAGAPQARDLKPCGTYAAYMRHVRDRTIPCRPCMDACAAYARGKADRKAARSSASETAA